jgi:hypothetical protein
MGGNLVEVSSYEGRIPDVGGLAEGLNVVEDIGLIANELAEAADSHPALARLLTLDILGDPGDSRLLRVGRLEPVLMEVLERMGDARLANAADVLLAISPEYRGLTRDARYHKAAYLWNPEYKKAKYFLQSSKKILRDIAGEIARLQEQHLKERRSEAAEVSSGQEPPPSASHRRLARAAAAVATALAVALGVVLYVTVGGSGQAAPSPASSARAMERRYDGKDPEGKDGPQSKCVDIRHPSQPVTQVEPSVIGPSGHVVGRVQLRTSPICPVIWARVYWIKGSYVLPSGWTLHIVMHRRYPLRVADFIPYDASQYVYGNMLATARGCVYASVFFADGSRHTPLAITPCMKSK